MKFQETELGQGLTFYDDSLDPQELSVLLPSPQTVSRTTYHGK